MSLSQWRESSLHRSNRFPKRQMEICEGSIEVKVGTTGGVKANLFSPKNVQCYHHILHINNI